MYKLFFCIIYIYISHLNIIFKIIKLLMNFTLSLIKNFIFLIEENIYKKELYALFHNYFEIFFRIHTS